ncbi:MAG: MopE-related protein [Desulfobacterales bacterium]
MASRKIMAIVSFSLFICSFLNVTPTLSIASPAEYSPDNDRIFWYIHVSDTHIGARGSQDSNNLKWLVTTAKDTVNPEFIVMSGDLTDSTNGNWFEWPNGPYQQEWDEYKNLLSGHVNQTDYYDIPGNHDAYNDRYFEYYLNNSIQGTATGKTQISWNRNFDFGTYYFIGINTAGNDGRSFSLSYPWGDYAGLDADELSFIEQELESAGTAEAVIIYGHHALNDHGVYGETYVYYGAQDFINLMDWYGSSMYGYGHSHELREEFYSEGMNPGFFYFDVSSLGKSSNDHFNITAIDCNGLSTVTQAVNTWPVVLITAPLDRYLGGVDNPYVYDVPNSSSNPIRALVFDTAGITKVEYRIDGAETWQKMTPSTGPNQGFLWEGTWDASNLAEGDHTIEVMASGSSERSDSITVKVAGSADCTDADGDGYYAEATGCWPVDCDDTDAAINPGAVEVCDGKDNDCDGEVDEGVQNIYYQDADGDGYGDPMNSIQDCSAPSGYVTDNTDCDDTDASVNPGAAEVCDDGIDNDCDGEVDEGCSVNQAPSFTADTIDEIDATENIDYNSTLADDASDPEGDAMTFSKVFGPMWLTVASDGKLSGTPSSGDVGSNTFSVRVEATGGYDTADLNIMVKAAQATTTMHVADIQVNKVDLGKGKAKAEAVVTIVDSAGQPVGNATVTVSFTGAIVETRSGVTDGGGQVTIQTQNQTKQPAKTRGCVDGVTHASYTYQPEDNVITCDNSW